MALAEQRITPNPKNAHNLSGNLYRILVKKIYLWHHNAEEAPLY